MLIVNGNWDKEAEVVVVGYGAAGAAAALAACDRGAQTLVLEKQPRDSHFSASHMCAGGFLQPKDRAEARRYFGALTRLESGFLYTPPNGWAQDAVNDAFVEYALDNRAWAEALGGVVHEATRRPEHGFPGADSFTLCRFQDAGLGMMRFFHEAVKNRGIEVMYSTSALRLLTNLKGEVIGVQAATGEDPGKRVNIRAARGVVLTLGGFEFDEEMKFNYLKVYPSYFTGSEASTGDGVRMALDVGAQLWQ